MPARGSTMVDPKVKQKAHRLFLQGAQPSVIAEQAGVTVQTVQNWAHAHGWAEERAEAARKAASKLVDRVAEIEVNRKSQAIKQLRQVRENAIEALLPTLDEDGNLIPGLRPKSFMDASSAVMGTIREEADLLGWKALPPQIIQVVVEERQKTAAEVVRLAVQVLLAAIPPDVRPRVTQVFKQKLSEIEDRMTQPPLTLVAQKTHGGREAEVVS